MIDWLESISVEIDWKQSVRLDIKLDYKIGNSSKRTNTTSTSTLWTRPPIARPTSYREVYSVPK